MNASETEGEAKCGQGLMHWRRAMGVPASPRQSYKLLAIGFTAAALVWIAYGLVPPRFVLFPLIGLANLSMAWYCRRMRKGV